jgi:hypothetical protein
MAPLLGVEIEIDTLTPGHEASLLRLSKQLAHPALSGLCARLCRVAVSARRERATDTSMNCAGSGSSRVRHGMARARFGRSG